MFRIIFDSDTLFNRNWRMKLNETKNKINAPFSALNGISGEKANMKFEQIAIKKKIIIQFIACVEELLI